MGHIVDLFIFMLKGIIIGIVASAPMGPVGILCIRRTIKKGRIYGIVTGAGAALSDVMYALLTGYGLSLITPFTSPKNIFWVKIVGGIMLLAFGFYMYRTGPRASSHPESKTKGTVLHNFVTSFFITFCNPAIIFLFLALFNMLAPFAGSEEPMYVVVAGYTSIVVGAMLWWLVLTYAINKMNNSFGDRVMLRINRAIGGIVIAVSIIYTLMTVFGISIINDSTP